MASVTFDDVSKRFVPTCRRQPLTRDRGRRFLYLGGRRLREGTRCGCSPGRAARRPRLIGDRIVKHRARRERLAMVFPSYALTRT